MMVLAGYAGHARADEHMVLVDMIDVGGNGLGTFDISFVDPKIDLYVLSDRTNASVDFFDASDDTFIGRVAGFAGQKFAADGVTANNTISGPDGVTIINGKEVWAGDGDSTVKVIDIASFQIVDTISTGGKFRCDEMAWDSADHILAVANNADAPPFVTLINTDTRKVVGKIVFDGTNGTPDATLTGIEQPQWSPKTGLFYVSVPQIFPTDPTQGGISVIDPSTMTVIATYPVSNCSPAGLTLGPRHEAMIGCSGAFVVPPNTVATTQSIIINLDNGDVVANITQAGGNDEVWFDNGTQHYYLAARSTLTAGKVTPILGTVDARTYAYDSGVSTSTTAHSVAADRVSHHVFVPIGFVPPGSPAGTDPTNPCPTHGCIAVYLPSSIDDDDLGTLMAKR
ncbi:MAG: hypothetical protein P4L90_00710 [Rhodopila sp.]|nr:hypothetical protein [Rhodopila sp.]